MDNLKVGFAICGSFCTYEKMLSAMQAVKDRYGDITPIMSENSASTDTRFGTADHFISEVERICGKKILSTIEAVEYIGPENALDILVIAPCTGNTLAKIAHSITDTAVTMACKAHLRNNRPVVIAISTNDGLSGNASNLGLLLNRKNFYFVPFCQDDAEKKPFSLVADLDKLCETLDLALKGRQLQPILCVK
ncbi:MAG: dipicolinate synthase subunit B [Clostridiales bacterium]|nr:dipicolinate synthase subunit B [Clostridiales bacterium]